MRVQGVPIGILGDCTCTESPEAVTIDQECLCYTYTDYISHSFSSTFMCVEKHVDLTVCP